MTEAAQLLIDLARRGIALRAEGGRLRFHPADAVSPDLLARLRAHKAELLEILAGGPDPQDDDHGAAVGPADGHQDGAALDLWIRENTALPVDPCAVCRGVVWWQDLRCGWHCEACHPRTTGPRLREQAQRLRERYSTSKR